MNLFVFAIGGTGSKVLTSLIMQLATGVRPVDPSGEVVKNLTIVPIIIDPHEDNAGLKKTMELLDYYRKIRRSIYGEADAEKGFFSVKVATLKDLSPDTVPTDTFFFKMNNVSQNSFKDFIKYDRLDRENKAFASLLFSEGERETFMKEGFYGSPNIGSVALNEFKDSHDFKEFVNIVKEEDRIFFIGSIFGGTGAAGLPLLITNIRHMAHNESRKENNINTISRVQIGSLIVMPYFSISDNSKGEIQSSHFINKTKSALRYYAGNLNKQMNACYYIADTKYSKPFPNDPGRDNNQEGNKAHLVEWVGALSVIDFLATSDSEIRADEKGKLRVYNGVFKQYGLATENRIVDFAGIGLDTKERVMHPMIKFHLLKLILTDYLEGWIKQNKSFVAAEPKIEKGLVSRTNTFQQVISAFLNHYDRWQDEMRGNDTHSFTPFTSLPSGTSDLSGLITSVKTKKRKLGLGNIKLEPNDIVEKLNAISKKNIDEYRGRDAIYKLFDLSHEALDEIVNEYFEL